MIFEVLAARNRELGYILEAALERLVFGSRLVFNQTWEDPEIDQRALAVAPEDTVLR